MLKMRLQRIGRKNNPSYRVLVVDSRQGPKSGKFIDMLGSYDPKVDRIAVDGEKAKEWIKKGVQVSPTVHNILVGKKIIEGRKINVLPQKSPVKKEGEEESAAPSEAVEAKSENENPVPAAEESESTAESEGEEKSEEVPKSEEEKVEA